MQQPTYVVQVTRPENRWGLVVQNLDGGCTEILRFAERDVGVRDLIAELADREPDSFDIDWHYVQGEHDYTQAVEEPHRRQAGNARAVAGIERARREIPRAITGSCVRRG